MNDGKWHYLHPKERDEKLRLTSLWYKDTPEGRFQIFQGRPSDLDGKQFVYELRRPDGRRTRHRLLQEAKNA